MSVMTGPEFAAIRLRLGCGVVEFARLLGYQGNDNTASVRIRRFENGRNPIPDDVADDALALLVPITDACIDCNGTRRYPSGDPCKSCEGTGRVNPGDGIRDH